jgi:hypothetical protein
MNWTLEAYRDGVVFSQTEHPSGDAAKTKACRMRKMYVGNQLEYDKTINFIIRDPNGHIWQRSMNTSGWRIGWEWAETDALALRATPSRMLANEG